jgi:hypothetical protein
MIVNNKKILDEISNMEKLSRKTDEISKKEILSRKNG